MKLTPVLAVVCALLLVGGLLTLVYQKLHRMEYLHRRDVPANKQHFLLQAHVDEICAKCGHRAKEHSPIEPSPCKHGIGYPSERCRCGRFIHSAL